MTTCFLCTNAPVGKCDSCDFGKYCSEDHYKIHKNKSGYCQPFQMVYKEGLDRCLEATRDIKTFELVLQDIAAAWGTFEHSKTYCLVCLEIVDDASLVCRDCNLPMCDKEECRNSEIHQPECQILRNHKPEKLVVTSEHPVYALITPLRIFHLNQIGLNGLTTSPRIFKDILALTSHLSEQKNDQQRWNRIEHDVLPILRACNLFEEAISMIEEIIAILRTNCVGLTPRLEHFGASRGLALFPYFSMLNHSCVANCRYSVSLDNTTMSVRGMRPILKGEEITIHYVGISLGNIARKRSFNNQWKFDCQCKRCMDPTEFGSYLQAIKCKVCPEKDRVGCVLPNYEDEKDDLCVKLKKATCEEGDTTTLWKCRSCNITVTNDEVHVLMDTLQKQINGLEYHEPIEVWENALSDLEKVLHPSNYLCMRIKRTLIQLYGNQDKFDLFDDMQKICRKLELCRNYIDTYSKVDKGYSSWRGKVLEEMVGPYMLYNKFLLKQGRIDEETNIRNYKESIRMIKEASKCRQYEPQFSPNLFAYCLKDINDVISEVS